MQTLKRIDNGLDVHLDIARFWKFQPEKVSLTFSSVVVVAKVKDYDRKSRISHIVDVRIPDWSDSPPWAFWWAVDADGRAHWHSIRPVIQGGVWVYHLGANDRSASNKKQFDRLFAVKDWTQSLVEYKEKKIVRPTMSASSPDFLQAFDIQESP